MNKLEDLSEERQINLAKFPLTIVRSMDKQKARMESMKVILNSVDYDGREKDLNYALDPQIVISGAREIEIMDAQVSKNGKFIG